MILVTSSFSKSSDFKMFSVHTKTQSRGFQILPSLENVFEKLSLCCIFCVDGRLNRRNKAAFS